MKVYFSFALTFLMLISFGSYGFADQPAEAPPEVTESIQLVEDDTVMASYIYNEEELTVSFGDLKLEANNRRVLQPRARSEEGRRKYVEDLLQMAVAKNIISRQAIDDGVAHTDEFKAARASLIQTSLIRLAGEPTGLVPPEPTTAEIKAAYETNLGSYKIKESYKIQYLYSFCTDPDDQAQVAASRKEVEAAWVKLNEGIDFAEVSKDVTNLPDRTPWVPVIINPAEINPKIAQVVRRVEPANYSKAFEAKSGYMLIKVLDHTPESVTPLEQVSGKISQTLKRKLASELKEKYQSGLLEKYGVVKHYEILNDEPIDPEAVVFEVDGKPTTFQMAVDELAGGPNPTRQRSMNDPRQRQIAIDSLLKQSLRYQDALARGFTLDATAKGEVDEKIQEKIFEQKYQDLMATVKVEVSEDEVKAEYEANQDNYKSRQETKLGLIYVKAEIEAGQKPSKRAMAGAYTKAQQAYSKLKKGEDFEAIAKAYCGEDFKPIMDFSPMGPRGRRIDMAADELELNEISNLIETSNGFQIVKLLALKEPAVLALEEATDRIERSLKSGKTIKAKAALINQLTDAHNFKIDEAVVSRLMEQSETLRP